MANKDGIISIGFDYKKELEKMIREFESEMDSVSNNTNLSKGMKTQFDNIAAEMRKFKSDIEQELSNLGSGKVSQSSFKSFKQNVENKFKGIREDIDRLDLAVSTLNSSVDILGKGVDLSKFSNEFKEAEDYVNRTHSAIEKLIDTLGEQGISLFSFDNRNIGEFQDVIKQIDKALKSFDADIGAKFELFDENQAQGELNRLSSQLVSTLELMENAKKQMESMDSSTDGFKKARADYALFQLQAASLNDVIETLYETAESKGLYIAMDDKSLSMYEKYTDDLSDNLESIISYAETAKKELSSLLVKQKTPSVKVSSEMNPSSAEFAGTITIETTSSELWKILSPIMDDLQKTLNSNPVVAPIKLVVAPTAVSSKETGNLETSSAYSKKYQKVLAETSEDAVIDLEGVYKKTFTSIMDEAVSYAKETIAKIQNVFESSPIKLHFDFNEEEFKTLSNALLSGESDKKLNITGEVSKVKKEVDNLVTSLGKVEEILSSTDNKKVSFKGFDKFAEDITKSLHSLTELQSMLKALQNIEITLAKASGISSVTEIESQWENVSKLITNAVKLDGTFRKNANVNKLASEYSKYLDMGGSNKLSDIGKIKDNEEIINSILSKVKELNSQKVDTNSVDKADEELKSVSSTLDDVISRLDHMINLTRDIGNTFYKMFKDASVSDIDKQWSSIENKFSSIADETGKINLTKHKKDVQELMEMYQRYVNAGGMKSPFDLTDNTETIRKLNKVYEQLNSSKKDSSSVSKEGKGFDTVKKSVDSLTTAINIKTEAIKTEANTMELAARAEVKSIQKIIDALNPLIEKIQSIPELKIPKESDIVSSEDNFKKYETLTDRTGKIVEAYRGVQNSFTGLYSRRYGGKTFLTGSLDLSKSYAGGYNYDEIGKIYKGNLQYSNPLEMDAKGSSWNQLSLPKELNEYLEKTRILLSNKIKKFYEDISRESDNNIRNALVNALDNFTIISHDHFNDNNFDLMDSTTGEILGEATYFEQYVQALFSNMDLSDIDISKAREKILEKFQELFSIQKDLANNMLTLEGDYVNEMIPVYFKKTFGYYTDEIIHLAENAGFDGTIFKNIIDGSDTPEDVFVIFNNEQLKNIELIDTTKELIKERYSHLLELKSEYEQNSDGTISGILKSYLEDYNDLESIDYPFNEDIINDAINSGIKEIEYELESFNPDTGEEKYKAKEGEIERFLSELIKYAEEVENQYNKIFNLEIDNESNISSGNGIVKELENISTKEDKVVDKTQVMYRAFNSSNGISGKGISWFSDELETVESYIESRGKDRIARLVADTSKFLTIDANASPFNKILYKDIEYTTDELAEMAKQAGYAGIAINNVYDSFSGSTDTKASNIFAIFDENIVKKATDVTETIKVEESVKNINSLISETNKKLELEKANQKELNTLLDDYNNGRKISAEDKGYIEDGTLRKSLENSIKLSEAYEKKIESLNDELAKLHANQISSTSIEDVFQNDSDSSSTAKEEAAELEKVSEATKEAVQEKKNFITANEGVQNSANDSKSPLQLEADLMQQIAKDARDAADAKKEFVEANKQVKDSANDSNGVVKKDKYKNRKKISEDEYTSRYSDFASIANKTLTDNGNAILGNSVSTELVNGLVKVSAKIKTVDGDWKTFSAKIDADGNMFEQRFNTITKGVNKLNSELENFGKDTVSTPKSDTQKSVDKALNQQISAWKKLESIREETEKTDPKNEKRIAELEEIKELYQKQYDEAKNILDANQDLYNVEKQTEQLKQIQLETDAKISKYNNDKISSKKDSLLKKINTYDNESKYTGDFVSRVRELQTKLTGINITNPEDIASLKKIEEEINDIISDSTLLENKLVKQDSKIADIISKMKIFRDSNTNMSKTQRAEIQTLIDYAENLAKTGKVSADAMESIKIGFSGIKSQIVETGNTGLKFIDQIVQRTKDINAKFFAQYFSIQDWIRYIKQGIQTIKELNTAMVEVRKVSDETEASYANFQKTIASTAKEIASTNAELLNSSADYLRLGYNLNEAAKLAENTALFVNVGDGVDIDEAAEDIITAMKAFNIEAEDSMKIVDSYNQIGNRFALSASDIGEAMKRSASALETANNSFEESVGLITAMAEITQDADTTGTSLKVMSLRIRGAKADLESMGEDTDGLAESTSKLREQIQSLTGVDIMVDDNTFKSTAQQIKELGAVWDDLSDTSQAATLELIAGKSRANAVQSLIKNYKKIDEVIAELEKSEGSALRENKAIVDSIEGRIKILSATVEEFWQSFKSDDLIKDVISAATTLLELVTKITDKAGLLGTISIGAGAFAGFKNAG